MDMTRISKVRSLFIEGIVLNPYQEDSRIAREIPLKYLSPIRTVCCVSLIGAPSEKYRNYIDNLPAIAIVSSVAYQNVPRVVTNDVLPSLYLLSDPRI